MREAKPTRWAVIALAVLAVLLTPSTAPFATGKDLKIAMILWRGETKAEEGFKNETSIGCHLAQTPQEVKL